MEGSLCVQMSRTGITIWISTRRGIATVQRDGRYSMKNFTKKLKQTRNRRIVVKVAPLSLKDRKAECLGSTPNAAPEHFGVDAFRRKLSRARRMLRSLFLVGRGAGLAVPQAG